MVDVQKSKDEMEDEDTKEQQIEDVSDSYLQRRGLDTSTPFTSKLVDIGYTKDGGELAARIKTPDFDFVVYLGDADDPMNSQVVEFFADCPREILTQDRVKTETSFDAWLSEDLRRFGFEKNSQKYHIEVKDIPEIQGSTADIIDRFYVYYIYQTMSGTKPGVRRKVKEVQGISDEEFKVKVDLTKNKELEWIFDIPFQVDLEEHPVAELIEDQGSGDPANLENNSSVFVVHKRDLIGRVHPVGLDISEEWALISPKEYDQWNPHLYSPSYKDPDQKSISKFLLMYLIYVLLATFTLIALSEIGSFIF